MEYMDFDEGFRRNYARVRRNLERKDDNYLESLVHCHKPQNPFERIGRFVEWVIPLNLYPTESSVVHDVAIGILIERELEERSSKELRQIANSRSFLERITDYVKSIAGYEDEGATRAHMARDMLIVRNHSSHHKKV